MLSLRRNMSMEIEFMKHIFVINPAAGTTDQTSVITESLKSGCADLDTEVYVTAGPGDATRYVADYCRAHEGESVRFR